MRSEKWGSLQANPTPVTKPKIFVFNSQLAEDLGLRGDWLSQAECLSGQMLPNGWESWALAYGGHQFGRFNVLGDGRAHLLHEYQDPQGQRWDFQLKGSGRTPFSRGGDGRAALGPMLREYLISEAMNALGIPTTRSLAVLTTGEMVEREQLEPGGILFRVASSHIRVGTFEYVARRFGPERVLELMNLTIQRHGLSVELGDAYEFLKQAIRRQACLIAQWMSVGFIHGVMNSDNALISGETIDYGPCAFLDEYHPDTAFSSIDRLGRYRYQAQPSVAKWNMARLGETLIPYLERGNKNGEHVATELIDSFDQEFAAFYNSMLARKIGFSDLNNPRIQSLIAELLSIMAQNNLDFTNTFRELISEIENPGVLSPDSGLHSWMKSWQAQLQDKALAKDLMTQSNPARIPRNHLVEQVLSQAVSHQNLKPFFELHEFLKTPFASVESDHPLARIQPGFSKTYQTFCGT